MTTSYGTSHFISLEAAMLYYLEYNPHLKPQKDEHKSTIYSFIRRKNLHKRQVLEDIVNQKIADGEIHIGIPKTSAGERAYLNVEEGRYFIQKGQ